MARHSRRSRRALAAILVLVAGAGVYAGVRRLARPKPGPLPLLAVTRTEPLKPAAVPVAAVPKAKQPSGQPIAVRPPATRPVVVPPPGPKPELPKVEAAAPPSGNPLPDARARFDSGDLVAARKILNDALLAGQLNAGDRDAAREMLSKINQQVIFGRKVFKDDPFCTTYTVQSGDRLQKVAANNDITWELLCRVNGIADPRKVRALQTIKIIKGPFHAVLTKSKFTIDFYLGSPGGPSSVYVATFPVGLGKDDSTPSGNWVVEPHRKLKNPTYYSPRGEGIIAADDPKNPLGEFWIGLAGLDGRALGKASYGIHGTIDPSSIGREESLGCIRMRNEDVAIAFELFVEGKSTVVIRE